MDMETSLRQLDREWLVLVAGGRHREAVLRWGDVEPLLAGCTDLVQVVCLCARRDDPVAANAALSALLRLAGTEPLAARVALQALLPGLKAQARRARRLGWSRDDVCRWTSQPTPWLLEGELEQELAALAWEQVCALAGQDVSYPSLRVLEAVWRRLRVRLDAHRRGAARQVPLMTEDEGRYADDTSGDWEREGASLIREAVEAGVVSAGDGALIFETRVLGVPAVELAEQRQVDAGTLRTRRRRAERALRSAWERSLHLESAA